MDWRNNPGLPAKVKKPACGGFLVRSTRGSHVTRHVPYRALRAFGCADGSVRRAAFAAHRFVWDNKVSCKLVLLRASRHLERVPITVEVR